MNTTGQNGEKNGYKILLLLVVGLTAFSSAMKELNQLQQFSVDATRLFAQWSAKLTPAPVPPDPEAPAIPFKQVESCEMKQSLPSVELPWLSAVTPIAKARPRAVVPRPSQIIEFNKDMPKPSELQLAKLKKFAQIDIDPTQFDFTVTPGKPRTQCGLRIRTREHEIFMKSFNRSINLRFAS